MSTALDTPVAAHETASREPQAPLSSTGETVAEALAYRTAAAAFLASKGLLGEYDAWCERGKLPPDAVGRLIAVARAVDKQMNEGEVPVPATIEDAMSDLLEIAPHLFENAAAET